MGAGVPATARSAAISHARHADPGPVGVDPQCSTECALRMGWDFSGPVSISRTSATPTRPSAICGRVVFGPRAWSTTIKILHFADVGRDIPHLDYKPAEASVRQDIKDGCLGRPSC